MCECGKGGREGSNEPAAHALHLLVLREERAWFVISEVTGTVTHDITPGFIMSNRAWVTLATNDSYGLGALVLAHSLRRAGSIYPAAVLITPSVTEAMRERLRAVFAEVVTVDVLDSRDAAHLALLQRPELGITFTKIHCWSLTQYEKCVFLDADTLVMQNCDELFDREELSAAPDVGWPDCFNSGVFVYKPSQETFEQIIKFAQERGSFDGGDQGLLNSFFSDWARGDINKHLPFLYNVTSAAFYSYIPALKHYGQNLKIIHFIGIAKPWLQQFNWESRSVEAPDHLREFLQLWWDLFVGEVHPQLDVNMVEVPEVPPELPPQDIGHHYTPVVDPESEFPWHRPDATIQEEFHRPNIDIEQFHDPWAIYGGQIPYFKEDVTQPALSGRMEDHEEMKKYAWEYQPPHESTDYHDYQQEQPHQDFDHSHHEGQYPHWEVQSHHSYGQDHGHDHSSNEHSQQHSHEQHHHQQEHHSTHHHYTHWQPEPQSSQHHKHFEDKCVQQSQHHGHHHEYFDQGHIQHSHDYQHTHSSHKHDHQTHHNQPANQHSQGLEGFPTKVIKNQDHEPPLTKLISHITNTMQQVHHVHIHHEVPDHVKHKGIEDKIMNGDISDNESEFHEEIRPRHPYDGFYLKHRAVIDSHGRKICTHEIPPTPTPSPPPEYECEDDPPNSLPEEIPLTNGYDEEQSGVAGNLARVVPGAGGSQREALDELTRRQGWEAGNIDYMGADSFDNIWAKISQTLSQPRTSPPKQPSPPKENPVEVEQAKLEAPASESAPVPEVPVVTSKTATAPEEKPAVEAKPVTVESAPLVEAAVAPAEAAPAAPAEAAPAAPVEAAKAPVEPKPESVEAPAPVEAPVEAAPAPTPTETVPAPAPAEAAPATAVAEAPVPIESAPVEQAVEAKTEVPVEAPKPTEAAPATETPVATKAKAPEPASEAPTPAEVPTPVEAATESKPADVPASEIPSTVEAIASVPSKSDIPATVEACAPGEGPVSTETSKPEPPQEETKTEPTLPPTPPASPKSPEEAVESPVVPAAATEAASAAPVEAAKEAAPITSAKAGKEAAPVTPAEAAKAVAPVDPAEAAQEAAPVSPVEAVKETAPVAPKVSEPSPASQVSQAAEPAATPEKPAGAPVGSDSPPLANTPSKDEAPALPAAKSEERRKGGCKLRLEPPAAADPLPTPDSELEDAAALATSIIASELSTPTVTSPSSEPEPTSPPAPLQPQRLSVDEPEVPTPPVGAVSLAQIGVKTPKAKSSTAAQIESSVTEKTPTEATPTTPTTTEAPKKKIVKKVVKKDKEGASTGAGGDAPVPPPRKKEKKPKEK